MLREIYGVEQSNHGHCYRWIFTKEAILEQTDLTEEELDDEPYIDDRWPIGGSNSSATFIQKLNTEEEVKEFFFSDYDTDLDDPMLIDIAEGIVTIDTDDGYYDSITSEFVKLFNIPNDELTWENPLYQPTLDMIRAIEEKDTSKCSGIDYENPFYGKSEDMRLSEVYDLYDEFVGGEEE